MPLPEKAPDTSFPLNTVTKEPLMFGPNITGVFNRHKGYGVMVSDNTSSGAFFWTEPDFSETRGIAASSYSFNMGNLGFRASRSNSTYGSSSVVQPSSSRMFFCIKT